APELDRIGATLAPQHLAGGGGERERLAARVGAARQAHVVPRRRAAARERRRRERPEGRRREPAPDAHASHRTDTAGREAPPGRSAGARDGGRAPAPQSGREIQQSSSLELESVEFAAYVDESDEPAEPLAAARGSAAGSWPSEAATSATGSGCSSSRQPSP